ncbi:MAG: helix-turn-helix domain-containing protein [Acidimicrobiales bacterium]
MSEEETAQRVRALRAEGRSPKEIARALGLRPAAVAPIVQLMAREAAAMAPEPALVGCWVSSGWSEGLTAPHDWPDRAGRGSETSGLASVLVVRAHRYGKVSACGYLVDVYCLGAKEVLGPRVIDQAELPRFVQHFFSAYDVPPIEASIDLARHLVWGAIDYARGLGFEPDRSFPPAAGHLGPLTQPSRIGFGRHGKPYFVQGPRDDAAGVLETLEASVGTGNFHFLVAV